MTERYVHPELAFSLHPVSPYRVLEEEWDRVVLALHTAGEPTLIATVDDLLEGTSAEELTDAGLDALAQELSAFHLLDRSSTRIDGRAATRTLSHHVADGRGMTLEQWRVADGDSGWTVSASCPTLAYPSAAEGLAASAETFSR